jgi:ribonuclease III
LSRAAVLEQRLGHRFANGALLEQALTHRGGAGEHNERLEFLGDSVLDCVVAEELFRRFATLREGSLHRLKESLVREESLAVLARELGLEEVLRPVLGHVRPAALADTLEAIFGAVFVDAGYDAARGTILGLFAQPLARLDPMRIEKDSKSVLQELVQGRFKKVPEYRLVATRGAAHERSFDVECSVPELGLVTSGSGPSRQKAEQQAASAMLEKLA